MRRGISFEWAPYLGLAALALIWGYNWVVMKVAVSYSGPFSFAALRCLGGGIALWAALPFLRRPLMPGSFSGALILGLLQSSGFIGFATWALVTSTAGRTAVLVYTMPFWLQVFAWPILGERVQRLQWLALSLALAGLVLVFEPWTVHLKFAGIFLALLAGFLWALAGIWIRVLRQRKQVELLSLTAWQSFLGGIPLLILGVWYDERAIDWTLPFAATVVYNAVPATAIAFVLWFYALQELPAGRAGMGTLFTPIIGVGLAWAQLGEMPGLYEGFGMLLIFAGLAVLTWDQLRETG